MAMSEVEWMDIFGDNLRDILLEQKMSRQELADASGLTKMAISNYINKKQMPSTSAVINMAHALSMSIDEFIYFDDTISR